MQPRSEGAQRCLQFELASQPRARVFGYRDYLGNSVHHFDMPARHAQLTITARAQVQLDPPPALPDALPRWRLGRGRRVGASAASTGTSCSRAASRCGRPLLATSPTRSAPAAERAHDPLTTVRQVMAAMHRDFEYAPQQHARRLADRRGAGRAPRRLPGLRAHHDRDAAALGAALPLRERLPRATRATAIATARCTSATHAWVEVLLPGRSGWVGFDPTNNIDAGRPPHPRRHRPRLRRRAADARRLQGRRRQQLAVSVDVTPARRARRARADAAGSAVGDRGAAAPDPD